ncbi:MAG: rod shape-determining protein [Polyangiaceae bacterium]
MTEAMLRYFIARAHNRKTLVKPRIIICVPSASRRSRSGGEREAESAGAREVYLIEEPMAAAIGVVSPSPRETWSSTSAVARRRHLPRGHRVLAERARRWRQDG